MVTTIFMKTPGIVFVVQESEEEVMEQIREVEAANSTAYRRDRDEDARNWIELSSRRPEEQGEDGGNGDNTIDTALHIKLNEILAVGG